MGKDNKKWAMYEVAESFRWLFKDKLISMDNVARTMISEMKLTGVKNEHIAEYLPQFFNEVMQQALAEQAERYDKKKGA